MGCLASKHETTLAAVTEAICHRYLLPSSIVRHVYEFFAKVVDKSSRNRSQLNLNLTNASRKGKGLFAATSISFTDFHYSFGIPPTIFTLHLFEIFHFTASSYLTFPEFLEMCSLFSLLDRQQLIAFAFHSFPLNEFGAIPITIFLQTMSELKSNFEELMLDMAVLNLQIHALWEIHKNSDDNGKSETPIVELGSQPVEIAGKEDQDEDTDKSISIDIFKELCLSNIFFITILNGIQQVIWEKTRSKQDWLRTRQSIEKKMTDTINSIDEKIKQSAAAHDPKLKNREEGLKQTKKRSKRHGRTFSQHLVNFTPIPGATEERSLSRRQSVSKIPSVHSRRASFAQGGRIPSAGRSVNRQENSQGSQLSLTASRKASDSMNVGKDRNRQEPDILKRAVSDPSIDSTNSGTDSPPQQNESMTSQESGNEGGSGKPKVLKGIMKKSALKSKSFAKPKAKTSNQRLIRNSLPETSQGSVLSDEELKGSSDISRQHSMQSLTRYMNPDAHETSSRSPRARTNDQFADSQLRGSTSLPSIENRKHHKKALSMIPTMLPSRETASYLNRSVSPNLARIPSDDAPNMSPSLSYSVLPGVNVPENYPYDSVPSLYSQAAPLKLHIGKEQSISASPYHPNSNNENLPSRRASVVQPILLSNSSTVDLQRLLELQNANIEQGRIPSMMMNGVGYPIKIASPRKHVASKSVPNFSDDKMHVSPRNNIPLEHIPESNHQSRPSSKPSTPRGHGPSSSMPYISSRPLSPQNPQHLIPIQNFYEANRPPSPRNSIATHHSPRNAHLMGSSSSFAKPNSPRNHKDLGGAVQLQPLNNLGVKLIRGQRTHNRTLTREYDMDAIIGQIQLTSAHMVPGTQLRLGASQAQSQFPVKPHPILAGSKPPRRRSSSSISAGQTISSTSTSPQITPADPHINRLSAGGINVSFGQLV